MTVLKSISQTWCDFAEAWRELFKGEASLESPLWLAGVEDDPRDAEARERERERIEIAIISAHFHF